VAQRERDRVKRADLIKHAADRFAGRAGEEKADHQAGGEHDGAFAQDHLLHRGTLRAECHADADLTRATRHRVRLHAVQADRGQPERENAEDREHGRAGAHRPKLHVGLQVLLEASDRQDRESRVRFCDRAAQQLRGLFFTAGRERLNFTKKKTLLWNPRAYGT
jgi:hypothetical protein